MCKTGKMLHERYARLLDLHGASDPRTQYAWLRWQAHVRGTASERGCARCAGLKNSERSIKNGNSYTVR